MTDFNEELHPRSSADGQFVAKEQSAPQVVLAPGSVAWGIPNLPESLKIPRIAVSMARGAAAAAEDEYDIAVGRALTEFVTKNWPTADAVHFDLDPLDDKSAPTFTGVWSGDTHLWTPGEAVGNPVDKALTDQATALASEVRSPYDDGSLLEQLVFVVDDDDDLGDLGDDDDDLSFVFRLRRDEAQG